MGAPPLIAILLGAGPIKVAPVNWSSSHRSTSHQSTSHQSTSHRATYHQSFIHWSSSHQSTSHQSIRHRSSSHRSTSQPGTSQPGISFQSFAYDLQTQIPPGYFPINVPIQNYAPSISSHISHGSVHRLPNVIIPGYEHSERSEFPNPATSSKQIIPLEPDFSQISDPSVMIDPPNSTDISLTRPSRKEQSKRDHKSKKRRRHRSSSSSTSTSRSDS